MIQQSINTADRPRDAARRAVPRRSTPDRYRAQPLTGEQIAHFYARVDAARERRRKAAAERYAGNAGEIRRALEECGL